MILTSVIDGFFLARSLELSGETAKTYRHHYKLFTDYLGDPEFAGIRHTDIQRYLNHLVTERGCSHRYASDNWISLSSLWTWAVTEKLCSEHMLRGKVKRPRFTKKQRQPFTEDECRRLVTHAEYATHQRNGKAHRQRRPTAKRDKAIIVLLLDTGLRASELCDLNIGDYNETTGRILVQHGKGHKERAVFIGKSAQLSLWRYLVGRTDKRQTDPLFASDNGRHIDRAQLRKMLVACGNRASVINVHPHRFRHTFAINFLRNGGNVFQLQDALGHESLETVKIYARLAEVDLAAAAIHSPADNWKIR